MRPHTSAVMADGREEQDTSPPEVWTILVAAGAGARFGADKLALDLAGVSVRGRSLAGASAMSAGTVCVVRADDPELASPPASEVVYVAGGASRSASVRNGLAQVPLTADVVLVHDAARPLADEGLYQRVIDAVVDGAAAAVPVVAVVDTIRSVDGGVVDRDHLRAVQTPQGFVPAILRQAHDGAGEATDDAALVEALGHHVVLVDGDVRNLKITRPADLVVAQVLIEE